MEPQRQDLGFEAFDEKKAQWAHETLHYFQYYGFNGPRF